MKQRAGGRIAASPATAVYTASRCQSFFACWVVNSQFVMAPQGWTFEPVAIGNWRIYPNPADVPDLRRSIVLAGLFGVPAARTREEGQLLPQPTSRTFAVSGDLALHCFEIWAVDAMQALTDSDFSLFVLVPG